MATPSPERGERVDIGSGVIMLDLQPSIGSTALVALRGFGMGGGEESSDPPVIGHTLSTPTLLSPLPRYSVVEFVICFFRQTFSASRHSLLLTL